ncbi:hypothetical protein mRhiFer1_008673 [Rhinolophus ferrumequinum]|uniref:Uncharacterized protein n=1 Tax=Rhinolophus ferrumequinum TaxID=59479 RepID=A0A7J7U171_RHIFE|nr:hypothetical protein mRhiFer1_008673 [Rhinolophus ferrumequinum]
MWFLQVHSSCLSKDSLPPPFFSQTQPKVSSVNLAEGERLICLSLFSLQSYYDTNSMPCFLHSCYNCPNPSKAEGGCLTSTRMGSKEVQKIEATKVNILRYYFITYVNITIPRKCYEDVKSNY